MRNGFELIKAFYSWSFNNQDKPIKSKHIALYMFLLNQNNRNNWVEWFKCPYDLGMVGSAISTKRDYYKTLHDLENWGLIGYIPGQARHKSPLISLVVISQKKSEKPVPQSEIIGCHIDTQSDTPTDTQTGTQSDTHTDTPTGTHIKPITSNLKPVTSNLENFENFPDQETVYDFDPDHQAAAFISEEKPILEQSPEKKEKVPPKRKTKQLEILDQCTLPFNSDNFMKHWLLYLDYKQKQGKPYTSPVGMQAALQKCSKFTEQVVIESLVQSMSNNWQGFFPEKINQNGKQFNQTGQSTISDQFQRLRAKNSAGNSASAG